MESISLSLYCFCFIISFKTLVVYSTMETDTIVLNQTIKDGETIVSAQQAFELGFFSPGNVSQNRYLGIWYKRHATGTIVWVANRETPIADKSGELTLDPNGALVLYSSPSPNDRTVVWTSSPFRATRNPVAQLMDSGNLMVFDREDEPQDYVWQSFDHPGDTHLPGMKFGRSSGRGVVVTNFTSWKSDSDPSQGQYMLYMDFNGLPQVFRKKGDVIRFRVGSWNGIRYVGNPSFSPNPVFTYDYVSNENETYARFDLIDHSVLTRITVSPDGRAARLNWVDNGQGWFPYLRPVPDNCTGYEICGAYASCDPTRSPLCGCLEGFTPNRWDELNLTSGCQRAVALDCGAGRDGFRKYSSLKLPDTRRSWYNKYMTLEQCEIKCQNECGCTAYTTLDISYNIGCLIWYDELIDMRRFTENGQDIYIRMAADEIEKHKRVIKRNKKPKMIIFILVIPGLIILLLGLCLVIVKNRKNARARRIPIQQTNDLDLPLFSLSTLVNATNNFAFENKLGGGGFGPVYKGCLEDEREVAVKRLAKCSLQGAEEFKNEVIFISKLQHRNLVKILGCCSEGQEKMLVYEYMPNKGLDSFIFYETKSKILDWSQRFQIINGIARGLLYLHQDSRLRIIHRDLKAANILLDHNMNPKISDFGMARSFRGNETETNTERVVGTYGYMSPEYAGDGIFSVKSDVFSFGVLVLEVVSGRRNRGFIHQAHNHNLLGHAWRLYQEGKSLELQDACLANSHNNLEMLRSIHVGLLCVQHNPDDRPNMSTVVMMLSSEGRLSEPQQPGFYNERDKFGCETSSSIQTKESNNNITVTLLEPR